MQQQFRSEAETPLETSAGQSVSEPPDHIAESDSALTTSLSTQEVTEMLARVLAKARRRKIRFWTAWALVESSGILLPFVALHFHMGYSFVYAPFVALFGLAGMLVPMFLPLEREVKELADRAGIRAIGPLISYMQSGASVKNMRAMASMLTVLLPQLKASDANLISVSQRRFLYRNLGFASQHNGFWAWSIEFPLAILKALEQIGDEKAIPVVEKLANRKARTERGKRIKQAARECLLHLRANVGNVAFTQTLLRASEPEARADVLLRPAEESASPADELLRAPNDNV